jgi:hypothetical protein
LKNELTKAAKNGVKPSVSGMITNHQAHQWSDVTVTPTVIINNQT